MRLAVLILLLIPFLAFAGLDAAYHLRGRKPGLAENLLHLALGGSQAFAVVGAFRGDTPRVLAAGVLVAVLGATDEYGFHHALPARESDLHAKSHLALFVFLVAALALAAFPDGAAFLRALRGEAAP